MTWTTDWSPWPCVITSCLKILRVADGVRVSGDGLRIGHEQPQQRRETVHGFVQSVLKMQRRPHLLVVLDDCQEPAMNTVRVYMYTWAMMSQVSACNTHLLAMSVFIVGDRLLTPGLMTASCGLLCDDAAADAGSSGFLPSRTKARPSLKRKYCKYCLVVCDWRMHLLRTCTRQPSGRWSHSSPAQTAGGWRHRCRLFAHSYHTLLPASTELREGTLKLAANTGKYI